MKRILVIGATGNVGSEVVSQLALRGEAVRAMTRRPEAARVTAGVEVVGGDLTAPETLDEGLNGVETVFLVWTAPAASMEAAMDRILKRVRRIVFLTAPLKTPHPFFQQPNPGADLALRIEQRIETSGVEWTMLRAGMFALNARHFWGPQMRGGDVVRWPYLDAPTAPIDERDIAAVGVRVLVEEGHGGMEYIVTGPESLTQREQIATIGRVVGRELRIEEMTPDEARREWKMPAQVVNMLLNAWAAAVGQPAFVTSTVGEVTGVPARTFAEWVEANAVAFRG